MAQQPNLILKVLWQPITKNLKWEALLLKPFILQDIRLKVRVT